MFVGAAWVVTPTPATAEDAYTMLRALLRDLQTDVVAVTPDDHDVLEALADVLDALRKDNTSPCI